MSRKRSKYRPRGVIMDTMAHVSVGLKPLSEIDDALVILRIKNHDALTNIAHGKGTRSDMDVVIAALNIAEALIMQNVASAYKEQLRQGQDALKSMGSRGRSMGDRFVCTGQELTAINWAMEIHDAQLEVINVAQLETAIKKVAAIVRSGGARKI
jgi:hypothetical protein